MVDNRTLKKKPASHSRKATVAEEKITVVLKIEKKSEGGRYLLLSKRENAKEKKI